MTRFAVRCEETEIDHVICDTRKDAEDEADEMTSYHQRKFVVVELA